MCAAYNLDTIISDLLQERSSDKAIHNNTARGKTQGSKIEIYYSVWGALNTWIESKLSKQKGAGIAGFGCFCWELKQRNGVTQCRPMFIAADSFVKAFRVRRQRIMNYPQTTPIEEVNYPTLAIRFTNNLTKDMVFTGLKDIIQKIGFLIDRGIDLEIAFNFGVLKCKERRLKFEFNQNRIQALLPDNIAPGTYGFDEAPDIIIDDNSSEPNVSTRPATANSDFGSEDGGFESARRPGTAGVSKSMTSLPAIASARGVGKSTDGIASLTQKLKVPALPIASEQTAVKASNSAIKSVDNSARDEGGYEKAITPFEVSSDMGIPSDLRVLLTTLANRKLAVSKDEFRKKAQESVMQQAYFRCLEDMQSDATKDDSKAREARQAHEDWRIEVQTEKQRERERQQILKSTLDNQISLQHLRSKEERLQQQASIPAFFLGANAGMAASPLGASYDESGNVINSRQKINKDLLKQMKQNKYDRERLRKDTINKERNYLTRLAVEMDLCEAMERTKHLKKQKEMLEQWERDGHIRNLKKLTSHGTQHVKDYIMKNMADTIPPSTAADSDDDAAFGNSTAGLSTLSGTKKPETPSLSTKLNMSIGYDPRKGRTVA